MALVAGETEFAGGFVQVKDLYNRKNENHPLDRLVASVRDTLKKD